MRDVRGESSRSAEVQSWPGFTSLPRLVYRHQHDPPGPPPSRCHPEGGHVMRRSLPGLLALTIAALVASPTDVTPQSKDTLTVALPSHAPTLDPHMHFERVGILVNINMFDSLLHRSAKLEFEPSLATSWKALSDTTWEFKLRKGVKFHDGSTMSAED